MFEPEGTSLMMGGLHPRVSKMSQRADRRNSRIEACLAPPLASCMV